MRILFIGDVVGKAGRCAIEKLVPTLLNTNSIDVCIANGENAAGGVGITRKISDQLFSYGIDIITSGNHIWSNKDILSALDTDERILRPANYPDGVKGIGSTTFKSKKGYIIGIINLMGRVFMKPLDCPFKVAEREMEKLKKKTMVNIIDFHAEATSEKIALGRYLDGKVTAVVGTHTHVQTADEKIFPKGTAYITDAGMTGPHDSIIGAKKDSVFQRFLTQVPVKIEAASEDIWLHGVTIEADYDSGRALSIERISKKL
ncbi:MAG: TIGR00282 family metallophosphoesterase [bacterium]|nr:TIGR00282 family metallophosphoesterase [bacterium]